MALDVALGLDDLPAEPHRRDGGSGRRREGLPWRCTPWRHVGEAAVVAAFIDTDAALDPDYAKKLSCSTMRSR